MTGEGVSLRSLLPAPVEEVVASLRLPEAQIEVLWLIADAFRQPPEVAELAASRMVRPYSWLLSRVGAEGIRLTAAGFLPPSHVAAAVAELGIADDWVGQRNRENQTLPVLELRESATRLGLVRKYRGMLLATTRGHKLADDPVGLWWHIAGNMPPARARRLEVHACVLVLAALAGNVPEPLEFAARLLGVAGWGNYDGTPITKWQVRDEGGDLHGVLRLLGAISEDSMLTGPELPTPGGALFAHAALRTWPAEMLRAPVAIADWAELSTSHTYLLFAPPSKRSVTDLQYDRHIRNIYKVLLTRGMAGTIIYAIDLHPGVPRRTDRNDDVTGGSSAPLKGPTSAKLV